MYTRKNWTQTIECMKKERPHYWTQLVGFTGTTTEIECQNCKKTDIIDLDELEAIEYFYNEGWRARSKCYCPACAKKKLKSKK